MRILVGHASWQGSTAEIARRVAAVLDRAGATLEVLPVGEVGDLDGYDAVVLGSAVHNQSWMPEAVDFVHRHAAALSRRPVWLFSVGMSDGLPRPLRRMARTAQDQRIAAALREDVQPRGHRVFSGVCRPEQLPRGVGVAFRAFGGHFGDYRDWSAIEAWARQIAQELDGRPIAEGS
jgi:menaquinone-dependent protoporphyrinogen oxidase